MTHNEMKKLLIDFMKEAQSQSYHKDGQTKPNIDDATSLQIVIKVGSGSMTYTFF